MDKWEQMQEKMMSMSQEEKMKTMGQLKSMCTCRGCPSYTDCNREKDQLLFCAMGKAEGCDMSMNGCTCPSCPVTDKMGLTKTYYCIKGNERTQRGM